MKKRNRIFSFSSVLELIRTSVQGIPTIQPYGLVPRLIDPVHLVYFSLFYRFDDIYSISQCSQCKERYNE